MHISLFLLGLLVVAISAQRRDPEPSSSDRDRFPLTGNMRPVGVDDRTRNTDSGSASSSGSFGFEDDRSPSSNSGRRPDDRRPAPMNPNVDSFDSRNPGRDRDTGFNRLTTADDSNFRFERTTRPSRFVDRDRDRERENSFDRQTTRERFDRRTTRDSFEEGRLRPTTDRSDFSGDRFGGRPTDGSRFVISGSSNRDRSSFPQNYRIETEIQRVENKGSQLADGKSCDFLSACDTKVYAIIDTETPSANWPGSVPVAKWPVVVSLTNEDSPAINKAITRDVCGSSVNEAALRVLAVDTDSVSAEDEINKFKCNYPLAPRDVAQDPSSAQWGESRECEGTSKLGKSKLFARQRVYEISSSACNSGRFQ